MKRPTTPSKPKKGSVHESSCPILSKVPTVWEYLADGTWDDGKPREVSRMSIEARGGAVQVALHDPALRQSLYTDADTVEEALALMEGALQAGTAPWRPWKGGKGR